MFKASSFGLLLIIVFSLGCNTKYDLKNTEWQTVRFTIDSTNYLKEFEKKIILDFNSTKKLHTRFFDSLALAFVENGPIDTTIYRINKDTLFYIQGSGRDTSIILKLTNDSLIEHRVAGVVIHNAKFKPE